MKKVVITLLTIFTIATLFMGCEKNDYQHPLHRQAPPK